MKHSRIVRAADLAATLGFGIPAGSAIAALKAAPTGAPGLKSKD